VTGEGAIVTRPASFGILAGITRAVVLEVAARHGLRVEERPFRIDEAHAAREAFLTSATQLVLPVVEIDGRRIGDGRPGPVARDLRARFYEVAEMGA
jgi:D-alanine transaminase